MTQYQDAVMGEFYQDKPTLNFNTVLNYFLTKPVTFHPSAIITRVVQFPDVSFYQAEINYGVMCMQTQSIIIRAGQNLWVDDQFERNYLEAKKCGMKVGVYWFFDGRASPSDQAKLLVTLLLGKKLELEVYIDWERNYGGQHEGLARVVAMMEMVENAGLDIKGVGLYTGYYFFRANSNPSANASQYAYLKRHPLWLAWYTSNPSNVLIPAPWTDLNFWQFGTPVVDWGQATKELDMNWYNGTKQDFESQYGEGEPPMPIDHVELRPNTSSNRSIRRPVAYPQTPHIVGSSFGTLFANTSINTGPNDNYVYTSDVIYNGIRQAHAGDKWWKVTVGGDVGWVAEVHKGVRYLTVTPVDATPPTQGLPEVPYTVILGDGVDYYKETLTGTLKPIPK
jgi:GH25 family lysozyme M1 (1,4-beta-N-acetylmuramidase)